MLINKKRRRSFRLNAKFALCQEQGRSIQAQGIDVLQQALVNSHVCIYKNKNIYQQETFLHYMCI